MTLNDITQFKEITADLLTEDGYDHIVDFLDWLDKHRTDLVEILDDYIEISATA